MKKLNVYLALLAMFGCAVVFGEVIEFEGEAGFVSEIPDPAAAPYKDCGYAFEVVVKGQKSGEMLPAQVIVIGTAFTDRALDPTPPAVRGERLRFKAIPFEEASEELRTRQTSDQTGDFESPQYIMLSCERIDLFDPVWAANFVPAAEKLETPPAFPFFERTEAQEAARRSDMRRDLEYIEELLGAVGGGDFAAWNAKVAPLRQRYAKGTPKPLWVGKTFFKSGGWVFGGTFEDTASFRRAVLDMNNYLRDRNIDLIVIRIPGRAEICADLYDPELELSIVNPAYYELQKFLIENDVEYVDLTREMVERRLETTAPYWYIEPGEGHAAEGGCMVVADEIARRVARYQIAPDLPEGTELLTIDGMYNYPPGNPDLDPETPIPVPAVKLNGRTLPIAEDGKSEILLMGDSYFTHPSMSKGASIQHYFAWKSKIVPDLLCRMSAGSGLPRFLSRKGDAYLAPRKVVVWVTKPDTVFKSITPFVPQVYYQKKELLSAISGEELAHLDFEGFDGAPPTSFYSPEEGSFKVVPQKFKDLSENGYGAAGVLKLDVSEYRGRFPELLVVLYFNWNWTVSCETVCGDFSDFNYLSLSDYSRKFACRVIPDGDTLEFRFKGVKVLRGKTLEINKIEIYGTVPVVE